MSDGNPRPASGGLRDALARLAAGVLSLVQTRAELAALEFDEARERAKDRLVLIVVAAVCFAIGLLAATAFVVVYFWDSYRLAALGVVTLLWLLGGLLALWRVSVRQRTDPSPFSATLAEFQRDREWISKHLRRDP
jgi:uncharacterized membrane protein YqjE